MTIASGQRLEEYLNRSGVRDDASSRWLPGVGVDFFGGWKDGSSAVTTSHCSAAVASLALALGAPLPSPSAAQAGTDLWASEVFLANRIYDWLSTADASFRGWRSCDFLEAQALASAGCVVVAVTRGSALGAPERAGHIVLLRPEGAATKLEDVMCLNVGEENRTRCALSVAFSHHKSFPGGLRFYAHSSVYQALPPPMSLQAHLQQATRTMALFAVESCRGFSSFWSFR